MNIKTNFKIKALRHILLCPLLLMSISCSIGTLRPERLLSFDETMDFMADVFLKNANRKDNDDSLNIYEIVRNDPVYSYKYSNGKYLKDSLFADYSCVSFFKVEDPFFVYREDLLPNSFAMKGSSLFLWDNPSSQTTLPKEITFFLKKHNLVFNKTEYYFHMGTSDEKVISIYFLKQRPTRYKTMNTVYRPLIPPKL